MKRGVAKLALAFAMAFGLYKGAEAALAPAPGPVTRVFNEAAKAAPDSPAIREYRLPSLAVPENTGEVWRVRLGAWEMASGGHHTFLEFAPYCEKSKVCANKDEMYQIHGIAMDDVRKTYAVLDFKNPAAYTRYIAGDYMLKAFGVNHDHNRKVFHKEPDAYVDIYYGSKDDVLKMYLDSVSLAEKINRKSDGYELLDLNSNSVQRTLLDGLGIQVPGIYAPLRLTSLGDRIWTPGMEKSLLPADWDRQKARDAGGYGGLSGDALEKAARDASRGAESVWIPPAPKPGNNSPGPA